MRYLLLNVFEFSLMSHIIVTLLHVKHNWFKCTEAEGHTRFFDTSVCLETWKSWTTWKSQESSGLSIKFSREHTKVVV